MLRAGKRVASRHCCGLALSHSPNIAQEYTAIGRDVKFRLQQQWYCDRIANGDVYRDSDGWREGDMTIPVNVQRLHTELSEIKSLLYELRKAVELTRVPTEHPHIIRVEGVCGGRPIVAGTRISVRTLVERTRLGDSPEQIVAAYPPLTLAQVYDALSYYHEHEAEIESEVAANEEALAWVTKRSVE